MASDETRRYCLSDENNRDQLGKDYPAVLCLSLSSSWDDFVSLETKVCEKEPGWVLLGWVGGFASGKELQRSDEVSAWL